jgi:hypothetical protein
MSGEVRGTNEFKELWICDTYDIDLDDAGTYLDNMITALEAAQTAGTAILLDTTANGDAPLMASAFTKHEGNGDPANTGEERAKVTSEAKVDGLQKVADMPTYKKILAFNGTRKNLFHIDRRLGVVEKALNQTLKVMGDGTNNIAYVTTITGEQVGELSEIYQRRAINKVAP